MHFYEFRVHSSFFTHLNIVHIWENLSEFSKFNFMDNKTSPLVLKAWSTHEPPINWSITFRKEKKNWKHFLRRYWKTILLHFIPFPTFFNFLFWVTCQINSSKKRRKLFYFLFILFCFGFLGTKNKWCWVE